jgi:hypothetical protein
MIKILQRVFAKKTKTTEDITDVINKYERRFQWSDDTTPRIVFSRIVVR